MPLALRIENLWKSYAAGVRGCSARVWVLRGCTLHVELGERVVRDAQTINTALGYEMNTIEFAVQDGVPYAIDYLNCAPDFERDRITDFYFSHVVEKMSALVIDSSGAQTQ